MANSNKNKAKSNPQQKQQEEEGRQQLGRAMLLQLNLPQLQNLIKRDPTSYREDFTRQLRHYESLLALLQLNPNQGEISREFCELTLFLAHVTPCYVDDIGRDFPGKLMRLLADQAQQLHPDVRRAMVQALMLMRGRHAAVDQIQVLSLCFQLLRCRDKTLRQSLIQYIVADIRTANQKCRNNKLNKAIQNHLYPLITGDAAEDGTDVVAKHCLDICLSLYKKQVWNDAKCVNIIAEACLSPYNKVLVAAVKFFLGTDGQQNEDGDENGSDDENEVPDMKQLQFRSTITKKSRSQRAKLEKAMKVVKRKEKRGERAEAFNFSALHMLNDPQGMAEKLFARLNRKGSADGGSGKTSRELPFEVRVMLMNLISRIIGLEKIILLNFYPFLIRYLKAHQQDVTLILAITAQATHDLVPPDAIEPIIRAIVDNFVTDAFASEVIAAGINSIREICARSPLAITDELLSYICTFKAHRDKGVMMAARSLIALYRDVNPEMLPKRERGKVAAMAVQRGMADGLVYGRERVATGVAGAELLLDNDEDETAGVIGENPGDEDGWEVASSESDGEGGEWINVSSDDEMHLPDADFISDRKQLRLERKRARLGLPSKSTMQDEDGLKEQEEEMEEMEQQEEVDMEEEIGSEEESDAQEESGPEEELEEESGENQEGEQDNQSTTTQQQQQQLPIEMTRILTPADFAKIKLLKQRQQAERLAGQSNSKSGQKRPSMDNDNENDDDQPNERQHIIPISAIEGPRKKQKATKDERLASIEAGRKDRPKFGSRRGQSERGSLTNQEKSKRKNMLMMAHKRSVKGKKKRSLRDRQITQRQHIDRQKRMKH